MYRSSFLYNQKLNSVISDGCDLITAFSRVLSFYDPNKNKNYKSKILDCSYSLIFQEKDLKMYNINKTKNLSGNVKENKYDIIIYEPPRNKNFYQDSLNSSKIFSKLINENGIIIIKTNDFKEKNYSQLQGSFEVWDVFSDTGFYLFDNIVYNYLKPNNICETFDRSKIIHLYFMIFKKGKCK